jgi:acyl carrier protein
MNQENTVVNEKIQKILAEVLQIPVETITDDLTMNDVESWDSLKHMELIVSLEQFFGKEFAFDEIVAMRSVREIHDVLRKKGVAD